MTRQESNQAYYEANKERIKKRMKDAYAADREAKKTAVGRHQMLKKIEAVNVLGGKCTQCGEDHLELLTRLDHNRRNRRTRIPHTDYASIQNDITQGTRVVEIASKYGVTPKRIYQIKAMKLTPTGS